MTADFTLWRTLAGWPASSSAGSPSSKRSPGRSTRPCTERRMSSSWAAIQARERPVSSRRRARRVSATPLWVRGYELERNVPFAAASELFSSLRSDGAPPLDDLLSGETVRGRDGVEPFRLFEAIHLCLADRGPVLFLVDDVQWLDELSLALVHYLIRAAAAAGEAGTFLVAGRPSSQLEKLTEAARSFRAGDGRHGRPRPTRTGGWHLAGALARARYRPASGGRDP